MVLGGECFDRFAGLVLARCGGGRRVVAWLGSLPGEAVDVCRVLGLVVVESFLDFSRLCLVLRGYVRGGRSVEVLLFAPGVVWRGDFGFRDDSGLVSGVFWEGFGLHCGLVVVGEWVQGCGVVGFEGVVEVCRGLRGVVLGGGGRPVTDRLWGFRRAALLGCGGSGRVDEAWRVLCLLQRGRGVGFCHGNLTSRSVGVLPGGGGFRVWGLVPCVGRPEFDLAFWVVSSGLVVDGGVLGLVAGGGFDVGVFELFCGALGVLLSGGARLCLTQNSPHRQKTKQTTETGFNLRV